MDSFNGFQQILDLVNYTYILPIVQNLSEIPRNSNSWVVHDFPLINPCWSGEKKLLLVIWSTISSLISLFNIFHGTDVKLIGRKFSAFVLGPFLCMAEMWPTFQTSRIFPSFKDLVKINCSGSNIDFFALFYQFRVYVIWAFWFGCFNLIYCFRYFVSGNVCWAQRLGKWSIRKIRQFSSTLIFKYTRIEWVDSCFLLTVAC